MASLAYTKPPPNLAIAAFAAVATALKFAAGMLDVPNTPKMIRLNGDHY